MDYYEIAANVIQEALLLAALIVSLVKFVKHKTLVYGLLFVANASVFWGHQYWLSLLLFYESTYAINAVDFAVIGGLLLLYSIQKIRLLKSRVRRIVCPATILSVIIGVAAGVIWVCWSAEWFGSLLETVSFIALACASIIEIERDKPIPKRVLFCLFPLLVLTLTTQCMLFFTDGILFKIFDVCCSVLSILPVIFFMTMSFMRKKHGFSLTALAYVYASYSQFMCAGIYYDVALIIVTVCFFLLCFWIDGVAKEIAQ